MKNENGFVLSEIIRTLIQDLNFCKPGLLVFSNEKFKFKTSAKKARRIVLILGLFLIYNSLPGSINIDKAQKAEKRPNNNLMAICGDQLSTRDSAINPNTTNVYKVPFTLRNNLMWMEATVNGEKGLLMLDTGTDMLILNQNHFRGGFVNDYVNGVLEDMVKSQRKVVALQISNLPMHKLDAYIADLNHLEQQLQLKILGICGINFLQQFQWVIHYHERFIDLYPLDKSGDLLDKTSLPEPSEIIQLQKATPHLYVEVQIGKYTMKLALDTGTSSTIFDEKYKTRLLAQNKQLAQLEQESKVVGINGTRQLITAFALYNLQIGNTTIPPIQVSFLSLNKINRARNFKFDGIFNPLYLCHGTIGINWKKKQLCVWKDSPKLQEAVAVSLDK